MYTVQGQPRPLGRHRPPCPSPPFHFPSPPFLIERRATFGILGGVAPLKSANEYRPITNSKRRLVSTDWIEI